jgi:hypothetical protein
MAGFLHHREDSLGITQFLLIPKAAVYKKLSSFVILRNSWTQLSSFLNEAWLPENGEDTAFFNLWPKTLLDERELTSVVVTCYLETLTNEARVTEL